jgi:hypothetical protein
MVARSLDPRLTDVAVGDRTHSWRAREYISHQVFETDWQRQRLVERGIEIISEASRHLTDETKARHPEMPWQKVATIGNVLRHNYENIAAPPSYGSWRRPIFRHCRKPAAMSSAGEGRARHLALQLPFLKISESMGNHDSKIVGASSVD